MRYTKVTCQLVSDTRVCFLKEIYVTDDWVRLRVKTQRVKTNTQEGWGKGLTSHHTLSATTVCLLPSVLFPSLTRLINISVRNCLLCLCTTWCNLILKKQNNNVKAVISESSKRGNVVLRVWHKNERWFCVSLNKPACVPLCFGMHCQYVWTNGREEVI